MFMNKFLQKVMITGTVIVMTISITNCSKIQRPAPESEETPMPVTESKAPLTPATESEETDTPTSETILADIPVPKDNYDFDADKSPLHSLLREIQNSSYQSSEYLQGDAQSDTVRWISATYAIYINKNYDDWVSIGGAERDPRLLIDPDDPDAEFADVATYDFSDITRMGLMTGWKISSRKSAMSTIARLVDKGQRASYLTEMQAMIDSGDMEKDILKEYGDNEKAYRMLATQQAYERLGERALTGWDLSRANQVLGDCYDAEYISLEEYLNLSLEISKLIQEEFDSWEELADSYLLGYQFWQAADPQELYGELADRRESYEELKAMEDGPYVLSFDMDLVCTWDEETMAKNKSDFLSETLAQQKEKARFEEKPTVTDSDGYLTIYDSKDPDIAAKVKLPEGFVEEEFSDDRRVYTYNEGMGATLDYWIRTWEEQITFDDYVDSQWFNVSRKEEPRYCNYYETEEKGMRKYFFIADYNVSEGVEGSHHTAGDKTIYYVLCLKEQADQWIGVEAHFITPFDPDLKGEAWDAKEKEMLELISTNIKFE